MATAEEIQSIVKLYVGYYNRAPDPAGLNFWVSKFDDGLTLSEISQDFSTQAETLSNYPFFLTPSSAGAASFLQSVYSNLFNRTVAADDTGLQFWVGVLTSNSLPTGEVILSIIGGADTSPDKDVVANKVAAGIDFYIKTNALLNYTFDAAAKTAATDIQKNVTADAASIDAAKASTDAYIVSLSADPAKIINLTTNTDTPGAASPSVDTTGGSADDVYNSTFDGTNASTLSSSDNLSGGEGSDTLNTRVVSTGGTTTTVSPASTSVETFNITNQDSTNGVFILDFAAISGEMLVISKDSGSSTSTVAINLDSSSLGMDNATGSFQVHIKGDRSGTNDALSLALTSSGSSTDRAEFGTFDSSGNSNDTSFETLNVTTSGNESHVLLAPMTLKNVNVSGNAKLLLSEDNNFAGLSSVDASAMSSGGIDIDARAASDSTFKFTGSDSDDRVILSSSLITSTNTMSLSGGGGKDTITSTTFNLSASTINGASGFEVLESLNASTSLDASRFTEIHEFLFSGGPANSRVNITEVGGDDRFVFAEDQGSGDEAVRFSSAAVGNALTFELRAQQISGGEVSIIANTNTGNNVSAVGFRDGITKVTIDSTGTNTNANLITAIDTGSNNYYAFKNDNGLSNFFVTGDQDLTITAEAGISLSPSSDVFGFMNSVNLNASAFKGNLRLAGSSSDDVLVGGEGNDVIYGLSGDDVLTGNAGMDQFRFVGNNKTDNITDFQKGSDKIGFNFVDFGNTTATSEGTAVSSSDYVDNLISVTAIGAAEDNKLIELQASASQGQIESNVGAAVAAIVIVHNTSSQRGEIWFDNDWSTTSSRKHIATLDNVDDLTSLVGLSASDFVEFIA